MIELTLVVKKSITKKDFKRFTKGNLKIKFEKEIEWDDDLLCVDEDNFEGVIVDLGCGEILFISDNLLDKGDLPSRHVYYPEIDG